MIQRHEIKNKIAEILAEVNVQFEVLQKFDTDINVEVLNAKIAYLANFSAILSKISTIEKIEGSFEFTMGDKSSKSERQVLENTFKAEQELSSSEENAKLASIVNREEEEIIPEPFLIIKDVPVETETTTVVEITPPLPPLSIPKIETLPNVAVIEQTITPTELPVEPPKVIPQTFVNESLQSKSSISNDEKPNSINELFAQKKQEVTEPSASRLAMPIHDLKMAFSLNNRILFIRELFNGYNLAFSEAIEILNQKRNFAEAKQFLTEHYAEKNQWTAKEEVVQMFYDVIRNRYTS